MRGSLQHPALAPRLLLLLLSAVLSTALRCCLLQVATGDQVLAAPKVSSEGVFGNFKIPPEGVDLEWVVSGAARWLPAWWPPASATPASRNAAHSPLCRGNAGCLRPHGLWWSLAGRHPPAADRLCAAMPAPPSAGAAQLVGADAGGASCCPHHQELHRCAADPGRHVSKGGVVGEGREGISGRAQLTACCLTPAVLWPWPCCLPAHPPITRACPFPLVVLPSQTEEELKRMKGQGILVADIAAEDIALQHDKYYLVEDASGRTQLMTGGDAAAVARVLGIVLFVCRPPSRDTPAATTSELMSV